MLRITAVSGLALLLAILVLAGLGCGAGEAPPKPPLTKAQYVQRIKEIRRELGRRFVRRRPTGSVQTRAVAELTQLRDGTAEFSQRLSRLNPPAAVKDAHALWVRGLQGLARGTGPLISAMRRGSRAAYRTAGMKLKSAGVVNDLRKAQVRFARIHYPIKTVPGLPPTLQALQRSAVLRSRVLR